MQGSKVSPQKSKGIKRPREDDVETFRSDECSNGSPPRPKAIKRPQDDDQETSHGDEDRPLEATYSWNCDQIRTKIAKLIRSGEYKVTHFQRELGINSNSYGRFMKLKGSDKGHGNQAYEAASVFFAKRGRSRRSLSMTDN